MSINSYEVVKLLLVYYLLCLENYQMKILWKFQVSITTGFPEW